MDPKLEEYFETIQILCKNCVRPSEQNGKKLFIPQGLGVTLWHKILCHVAPLTEEQDDQVHRSNEIFWAWTRLGQQLEQFVTQCLSNKCVCGDSALRVREIVSEAGRNFIALGNQCKDDREDGQVGTSAEHHRYLVSIVCELLTVSLQIDHVGLAADAFVEAVVFPYARIAIGKSRSVNDQILGFKLWELAYRLEWNSISLMTESDEEYFYVCVMNVLSLAETANERHFQLHQITEVEGCITSHRRAVVEPIVWRTAAETLIAEWDRTRNQLIPAVFSSLIARAECWHYQLLPKLRQITSDPLFDVLISADSLLRRLSTPATFIEWLCYTYCKILSNPVFLNHVYIPSDRIVNERTWEPLASILRHYVYPIDLEKENFIDSFYLKLVLPKVDSRLPSHPQFHCSCCPYSYAKIIVARKPGFVSEQNNGNCEWSERLRRLLNSSGTPCRNHYCRLQSRTLIDYRQYQQHW